MKPEKLSWIQTAADNAFINSTELSLWLGFSKQYLTTMMKAGDLPNPRFGAGHNSKKRRWMVGDIRRWIKSREEWAFHD